MRIGINVIKKLENIDINTMNVKNIIQIPARLITLIDISQENNNIKNRSVYTYSE